MVDGQFQFEILEIGVVRKSVKGSSQRRGRSVARNGHDDCSGFLGSDIRREAFEVGFVAGHDGYGEIAAFGRGEVASDPTARSWAGANQDC